MAPAHAQSVTPKICLYYCYEIDRGSRAQFTTTISGNVLFYTEVNAFDTVIIIQLFILYSTYCLIKQCLPMFKNSNLLAHYINKIR